jgi:hypothetical protein
MRRNLPFADAARAPHRLWVRMVSWPRERIRTRYIPVRAPLNLLECAKDLLFGVGLMRTSVNDSATGTPGVSPSAIGVLTRLACTRAKDEGVEVESLLLKSGLTRHQVDDRSTRLNVKSQIKFLELAATTLKDELLGFHLAQSVDLRLMGLLYYVMASSETLEEVLRRGARYSSIVNEGIAPKYREGKDVGLKLEYVGVSRHSDRHQIESSMVILVRTCRQLANRHLPAVRVSFAHRRSGDISEFTTFFGCDERSAQLPMR